MTIKDFLKLMIPIGIFGLIGGVVEDKYYPGTVGVFMAFAALGTVIGVLLLRRSFREEDRVKTTKSITVSNKAVQHRGEIERKFYSELMEIAIKQVTASGRNQVEDYDIDHAFDEWIKRISGNSGK